MTPCRGRALHPMALRWALLNYSGRWLLLMVRLTLTPLSHPLHPRMFLESGDAPEPPAGLCPCTPCHCAERVWLQRS